MAEERGPEGVIARVRRGGTIGDRKGVHLPDSDLSFEVPTEADRAQIALARELGVDMLGLSFVSRAEEVDRVRHMAPELFLVAKIERKSALDNLRAILEAADGLMVARGDLGVEVELEQLPLVQKMIIQESLKRGQVRDHRHRDARVDGQELAARRGPRWPTSPTPSSTAPTP